jgi:hypothetical protein
MITIVESIVKTRMENDMPLGSKRIKIMVGFPKFLWKEATTVRVRGLYEDSFFRFCNRRRFSPISSDTESYLESE